MTKQEILKAFQDAAVEVLGVERDTITPSASLVADFEADSLDVVEVLMLVEEHIGVSIPDEFWEDVENIGMAIDKIEALVSSTAP